MIGLSTKAPRFEFVFTPTNKQFSEEKDCSGSAKDSFSAFFRFKHSYTHALYFTTRAFWVLDKTLAAHTYSS
jgi:hypothetical protein